MFRFSIRDVLWLSAVLAVGLAVGLTGTAYYASARAEQRRLQAIIDAQESTIADLISSVQLLQSQQK